MKQKLPMKQKEKVEKNVPWSISFQFQDELGNYKMYQASGVAKLSVDEKYTAYYDSHAATILQNYFLVISGEYGWQALMTGSEEIFKPDINRKLEGAQIKSFGLSQVSEYDLEPKFRQNSRGVRLSQQSEEKTIFQKFPENSDDPDTFLGQQRS